MKLITHYVKFFFLVLTIFFSSSIYAQINENGFNLDAPSSNIEIGNNFNITATFNWGGNPTANATLTIQYDNTLVSFVQSLINLPNCMSYSHDVANSRVIISMASLVNCTYNNGGSIQIYIPFQFLCPDSCVNNTVKHAQFTGTLSDNLNNSVVKTCVANGLLTNTVTLSQSFHSYNSANSEVTFIVKYRNFNCYKIKNPVFNVTLSNNVIGISNVYGYYHNYSLGLSGNTYTITPNISSLELFMNTEYYFFYIVKLPCDVLPSTQITSTISLTGTNCNIPNYLISNPQVATYTVPSITPAPIRNISVSTNASSNGFFYMVTNTGNTPLNIDVTNKLPSIHLLSITQVTSNTVTNGSVTYSDCQNATTGPFTLAGGNTSNNSVPTNTKKFLHKIFNLQPSEYVLMYINFDYSSSCVSPIATPPLADTLTFAYNCVLQENPCLTCGPGQGIRVDTVVYNKLPNIDCVLTSNFPGNRSIGDTLNFCYKFKNVGDTSLHNGIYSIPLPAGIEALASTVSYSGFTGSNPTIAPSSSIVFNLPTIPVSQNIYTICFKAVIRAGVTAGSHIFSNSVSGTNPSYIEGHICSTTINISAISRIDIVKKVKGVLDASYSTSGQGTPNSFVDYEITLRNSGTIPIDSLVVVDRIPSVNNLTILGNPNSQPINNEYTMFLQPIPANSNYSVVYTNTQNICTNWQTAGTNCNVGDWTAPYSQLNKGIKFIFNTGFQIPPGGTYVITFRTKIPASVYADQIDCNTAGFIARGVGSTVALLPTESQVACIRVAKPCDTAASANFQLAVDPKENSYTITSVLFNTYPNESHEWYVVSSPNPSGGPYTPVYSSTSTQLNFTGAQYNVYYTVIHKLKTECAESCSSVIQFQSNNKSDCCLAAQFWPNGPKQEPQAFSAAFETDMTNLGGGQYTINTYPTYTYGSNVTHQWIVLTSPNENGGPYTFVTQASGANFSFAPANDGLYYFVFHKIKSDCGEACYGQSLCRNCKNRERCDVCGVIDCSLLDNYLSACPTPTNLKGSCRTGILSWSAVAGAGGYQVELSLNDPACCSAKNEQTPILYNTSTTSINLTTIELPNYDCIRWRVSSKCDAGYGEWSSWNCYSCPDVIEVPFPKTASKTQDNTKSIKEISVSPQVVPNPNNGEMNLSMIADTELRISINVYNAQGNLVKSIAERNYPDGKFNVRLQMNPNTSKGIYIVEFKTNLGTFNKKVIIQ